MAPSPTTQTDIYDELVQKPNQSGRSAFFQDTLKKEAELARLYARKESQATRTRSLTNPRFIELLEKIQGLPFWINNRQEHKQTIQALEEEGFEKNLCCFNHCLGLPTKNGNPLPIFDYEQQIVDALENTDRVWIKKARGLGVTELIIRYIVWLCLRDNDLKGNIIFIMTGPRQNTAIEHVQRIERLFEPFGIYSETRMGITELNDVFIQTIPSKNIGAMRGYDRVPLIFLDEADFFPLGQQLEARAVTEGYIPKTNPKIIMVSTPNRPDGLFATMEREIDNGYMKLFLDYTVGIGKIYDAQTIEQEKSKEYFETGVQPQISWEARQRFPHRRHRGRNGTCQLFGGARDDRSLNKHILRQKHGHRPSMGHRFTVRHRHNTVRNNKVEVFHAESYNSRILPRSWTSIMCLKIKHHVLQDLHRWCKPRGYTRAQAPHWRVRAI